MRFRSGSPALETRVRQAAWREALQPFQREGVRIGGSHAFGVLSPLAGPNRDAGFPRQPVAAEAERGERDGVRSQRVGRSLPVGRHLELTLVERQLWRL
jgi:hypothetical protein